MVRCCTRELGEEGASDVDLMEAIAGGDRASFAEFHERFSGVIYASIYRVLDNRHDAEDVMQEVFCQIWRKARLYESSKGKALTWAATMARNRAIDYLRSKRRRARLREEYGEASSSDGPKLETRNSLDTVCAKERSAIVRGAVMQLSLDQREVIELAYFSGLTQREIASRLGEPLGTVKARIRRGVMKLHGTVSRRL